MSRRTRKAIVLAAALAALQGCATPPPPPELVRYSVHGGAVDVDLPTSWGTAYVWQVAEPRGIGVLVISDARARFAISASSVALRESPSEPADTSIYTFQETLRTVQAELQIDSAGCADGTIRPVTNGRLYGRLTIREGCGNSETYARIIAIDAQRSVLVSLEGRGAPGVPTADVVTSVFVTLEVDPLALPITPIAEDELARIDP